MLFVGASSRGGFSTNAMTLPSVSVGTTPNLDGSSTGCSAIVASPPWARWNAFNVVMLRSVRTSPLTTRNVSSKPNCAGGEADRAGGIEWFGFDGVVHAHAGDHVARVGLGELFRQIAQ